MGHPEKKHFLKCFFSFIRTLFDKIAVFLQPL